MKIIQNIWTQTYTRKYSLLQKESLTMLHNETFEFCLSSVLCWSFPKGSKNKGRYICYFCASRTEPAICWRKCYKFWLLPQWSKPNEKPVQYKEEEFHILQQFIGVWETFRKVQGRCISWGLSLAKVLWHMSNPNDMDRTIHLLTFKHMFKWFALVIIHRAYLFPPTLPKKHLARCFICKKWSWMQIKLSKWNY